MKICPQCQAQFTDDVDFCSNDGMKLRMQRDELEDTMIGKVLDGRWIIDSKLGEGGMGSVYLGRQRSVNRTVAIKTLRPELAHNVEFVDRFFREAQIVANINHPNCVTVLDFGQTGEDDLLFIAMEYLEGMPLADRLEQGEPLTLDDVLTIGDEIAAALEAAHSHHIIHRDLKPDNIFLQKTPNGGMHSKLLDFGIAKDSNASTQFTRTGQIFGTPDYMSPEQCSGGDLDGRSDLYSLGCIFYEMLCGRPPFEHTNSMAILMSHVTERPRPLSELMSIPPVVDHLVLRLLSKEPAERHASANELRQDLALVRATLLNQGSATYPIAPRSTGVAADAFADTMAGEALHTPPPPHQAPRHPTASIEWSDDTASLPPVKSRSKAPLLAIVLVLSVLIAASVALAAHLMSGPEAGSSAAQRTPSRARTLSEPASAVSVVKKPDVTPSSDAAPVTKDPNPVEDVVEPAQPRLGAALDERGAEPPRQLVEPSDPKPADKLETGGKKKKADRKEKKKERKERESREKAEKTESPQSNSPVLPEIQKQLPKIEKKIKTKSDQIVNDLFR